MFGRSFVCILELILHTLNYVYKVHYIKIANRKIATAVTVAAAGKSTSKSLWRFLSYIRKKKKNNNNNNKINRNSIQFLPLDSCVCCTAF